jgi:zinc protease
MRNIISILVLVLVLSSGAIKAQNKTTIPLDKRVKYGKLANGMTYYIMHNEEPKERTSLYFVQNVGAILENDSQNGLAHFLEHMAFNGLAHYPGKTMLNYLESYGIKFGADINAYTAQDQTVYNLSNIPSSNENLLDSALLVLHDWSGSLLLEDDEIEAERGVIHEEWRTRRNSRFRLMKQTSPYMYNHSQYAKRDVIGSLDIIDHFEHQELRDYYHKWYRPDLQAVIIVGDVDADKVEEKVKELFSQIPAKENPAERIYYPIEDSKELGFVVAKDKEAQGVTINWIFRKDPVTLRDEAYLRKDLATNMMSSMLNNRLGELTRKPDCPALSMYSGTFNLARTKDAAYLGVRPKENKEKQAFSLIMTELERAKKFGFTQSELDRVKTNYLSQYEAYEKDYDKVDNDTWAGQLGDFFLEASPFPSLEWEMQFAQETIPSITLEEVYALLNNFENINNSVIAISGPDKEEMVYPTKEELLDEIEKVTTSEITAYEDEANDSPLVSDSLTPKEFISETKLDNVDAKLYTLENGARVVIMPTELSKDEILFNAFSFGGSSLLKQEQLESAELATTIAQMSGVGEFNAIQLKKKLTGTIASVKPYIGTNTEGFNGSSTVKDFETLLQLLYQKFEHPRFEEEAFNTIIGSMKNQLVYIKTDNGQAFQDTISMISANYNRRNLLFNEEFVDHVDFNKAKAIYEDRIQDASDFTFIFVGNIDVEKDIPLIKKYIGSLSSKNRSESWVDHHIKPAEGNTSRIIERKMEVEKASVYYSIYHDVNYNLETRMYVRAIAELLNKRYLDTIREEEGGSYGVSVRPSISKLAYEHAIITMYFDCDPEKQEKLSLIMKDEIDKLVKNGVNIDDLNEIKKSYIKNRQESVNQNSFWLSVIESSLINDERISNTEGYNKIIEGMNAKSIQKFAKKFFKNNDIIEVVMLPEK